MAITSIKVANEPKQDTIIAGQENIKAKIASPKFRSFQKGTIARSLTGITNEMSAVGYEQKIVSISPVNPSKSQLFFNYNNRDSRYNLNKKPVLYGREYYTSGNIEDVDEYFRIVLKSDGIYASPVTKAHDISYVKCLIPDMSWQVIEFY